MERDKASLLRNKLIGVIVEIYSDTDIFIVLDGQDELAILFIQAQRQLLGNFIDINKRLFRNSKQPFNGLDSSRTALKST